MTKPCRPVELQRVVLGLLAKKLGTTPLALGGKLKHPEEDLPLLKLEEEPGWWAKLWRRIKGTDGMSFDASPSASEEKQEEALEEVPEEVPEGVPEGVEDGEVERKLAELLSEDSPGESGDEPELTEGTVRLPPGDPLVNTPSTPSTPSTPLPTAEQGIDAEASSPPPATSELSPKQRQAHRPEAIHRGVPIYGEEDFLYELRREVARCQRLGRPLTLILIQVTDLGQIVELVGSGFRRQLLWHVAEQALESLRQVDLAGHLTSQELVGLIAFGSGRYGGRRIVTRVQRAIKRDPFSIGEGLPAIVPALRFGIATFPKEGEDLDALMAHARRELAP